MSVLTLCDNNSESSCGNLKPCNLASLDVRGSPSPSPSSRRMMQAVGSFRTSVHMYSICDVTTAVSSATDHTIQRRCNVMFLVYKFDPKTRRMQESDGSYLM
jgi:hypothetical protein